MALPKEVRKVTPLSKTLAMILFIALPFVGFLLGMRYQEMVDQANMAEMQSAMYAAPQSGQPSGMMYKISPTKGMMKSY